MLRNKLLSAAMLLIATTVSTTTAMAQGTPAPAPEQSKLVAYGLAVVATVAVIALSIMSAKRTHR